jgi:hypothetical protein
VGFTFSTSSFIHAHAPHTGNVFFPVTGNTTYRLLAFEDENLSELAKEWLLLHPDTLARRTITVSLAPGDSRYYTRPACPFTHAICLSQVTFSLLIASSSMLAGRPLYST